MKGIVFAGCSNTWGHGLWYYSKLKDIPYGDEFLDIQLSKSAYINFKNLIRYPRLVSNHFNTYEVVKNTTSGTDEISLKFLELLFKNDRNDYLQWITDQKYEYDEIEYIIFQTTFPDRSSITIKNENGDEVELSLSNKKNVYEFIKSLQIYNLDTYEKFYDLLIKQITEKIKTAFKFYESKGIKCKIFCWTKDYVNSIKNDIFLSERFIKLKYGEKYYDCANNIIQINPSFKIINDVETFGEKRPKDHHPTDKMHKLIANSIIEHLEKNERL